MDVNKGRFAEIFPVVITAYKSTSLMDFCSGSDGASLPLSANLNISEIFHISPFFTASGTYVLKV